MKQFDSKASIYDYDDRIMRTYQLIKRDLSEKNLDLLLKYDKTMISQGLGKPTRHKNLQIILNLSRLLRKYWQDVTKEDIEDVVIKVMDLYADGSGQETYTTYDHKKILKIFFRWLKLGSREQKEVGDPPETKGIRIRKVKDKISREDLLTESDRTRLIHACGENVRDRALIDCHLEAGTRPGEILNLQIKHVSFDKYGAVLKVDGKTGARTIRLVKSTPSLASWINVHPFKDNPNTPLWINVNEKNFGKPLTYSAAYQMVRRRCRIANLTKRVYLNLFRHTEATETANYMTEAQMRNRHGWTSYSKMPGRYVHLSNADVEEAVLSYHGITKKKKQDITNLPKICPLCEMHNVSDAKICSKCSKPLDIETAIQLEEKEQAENKELRKDVEDIKKKLEERKYGPEGRGADYAKALVHSGDNMESKIITKAVAVMIELLFPEDKKQMLWKEIERAKESGEHPDFRTVLGSESLTESQKLDLLEKITSQPSVKKAPKLLLYRLLDE